MRLCVSFQFLTLVLGLAFTNLSFSAPSPDSTDSKKGTLLFNDGHRLIARRTMVENANLLGLSFRTGSILPGTDKKNSIGVELGHTFYRPTDHALHIGALITFESFWGAHADYQWNYSPGENYDPFYRVGLGGFFQISEEFAGTLKYERYHLRLSAGLEDLLEFNQRLRCEALLTLSTGGVAFGIMLGWAFP